MSTSKIVTVTTSTLEGWTINEYLGVVSSHVVAGTGVVSDLFAGFSDFFGGRSQTYQRQLAAIDSEAIALLQAQATRLGGNALVGLRVDHDEISGKSKSMLMCTAQATVVLAERHAPVTAIAIDETRRIDADAIVQLNHRKGVLRRLQDNAGVFPTSDEWRYLIEQRASEFIPWVIEFLSKPVSVTTPQTYIDDAITFLSIFPEALVQSELLKVLPNAKEFKCLIGVINKMKLMDIATAKTFIASEDTTRAKQGLALLECHQNSYSEADLKALEELITIIIKRFPRIALVVEERGLFGKKERWNCPSCKKPMDAKIEECESCYTDVWGFARSEPRLSAVLERLQNRTSLLRELLNER